MTESKPHGNHAVIYFDEKRKRRQVVRPTDKFDGNWTALVYAVTDGKYNK